MHVCTCNTPLACSIAAFGVAWAVTAPSCAAWTAEHAVLSVHRQGAGAKPLAEAGSHRHWVWQAKFSPVYDQLVLSCSSDAIVSLTCAPALAAPPRGAVVGQDMASRSFDDHEESVYSERSLVLAIQPSCGLHVHDCSQNRIAGLPRPSCMSNQASMPLCEHIQRNVSSAS